MPGAEPASPAGLRRGVESRADISCRMRSSPASQVEEGRGDAAAQTSSTFVPVTCIMTSSSAHIAVCPTQGLREAGLWAVLA